MILEKRRMIVAELGILINSLDEEQLQYVSVLVRGAVLYSTNPLYQYGSDITLMAEAQRSFMGSPKAKQADMITVMAEIAQGGKVRVT